MEKKIAIVTVAYNRHLSLQRLLNSLGKAVIEKPIPLYISIDKSNNPKVEEVAKQFDWKFGEKHIIMHDENLGLRKHVLSLGELLKQYDALVVLEDDLVIAPGFMYYVNTMVEKYKNEPKVAGVSLFNLHVNPHTIVPFFQDYSEFDCFFMQWAPSWGQIWFKDKWFDFKKWYENNSEEFTTAPHLPDLICSWSKSSWLKYHTKYAIENDLYFAYPYISYTTTCSDAGVHAMRISTYYQVPLQSGIKKNFYLPSFDECNVKYDSFFERSSLLSDFVDICIDLNGLKKNRQNNRYWLTQGSLPYKIIKRYSLKYKPIEANVAEDNPGDDIFLYDTTEKGERPIYNRNKLLFKFDVQNLLRLNVEYGLCNIMKDVLHTIKKRL